MKLVLAEKPSVAMSLSKVIGANQRGDGYMEGNGYLVSWCVGHLVELSQPEAYDEKYAKWRYYDLCLFFLCLSPDCGKVIFLAPAGGSHIL